MENEILETNGEVMTFDEILKDKIYQSEYDKKVTQALSTHESNLLIKLGAKDGKADTLLGELKTYREAQAKKEIEEREKQEKEALEKPELERLQGELSERIKKDEETAARLAKLALLEQKETVNAALNKLYGKEKALDLASVDVDYIIYLANQKVSDETAFEDAVELTLKEKPPAAKPPEMAGGAGSKPVSKPEEEALKEDYKKAAKLGKVAEMSRLIRLAKSKNINLE